MAPYKFDWTATISGTIEIDAENGIEASELFKTLNDQELVEQSEIMLARNWREVRFVTARIVEVHTVRNGKNSGKSTVSVNGILALDGFCHTLVTRTLTKRAFSWESTTLLKHGVTGGKPSLCLK